MPHQLDPVERTATDLMEKYAIPCTRLALAITYIWFGALKLSGKSPVADLVAKTVYFLPKKVVVPLMGIWELAIGFGLLFRVALRPTLILFFLQIAGTFSVLVVRPQEAFQEGNPLLLTKTGEFVLKNLILLAAGVAVASTAHRERENIN